jgi:antitoxin FitA
MPNLLVRNIPEPVVQALKRRAELHRRSLQQEILTVLEAAADEGSRPTAAELAAAIREQLAASGRAFGDSVELIREDRRR